MTSDNAFVPATVTINAGDTVRWTNNDPATKHTATRKAAPAFDSGLLPPKGTFSFTIQVKDGAGNVARQAFSIAIRRAAALTITFPTTCCNDGTVGTSYLQNFFLSGGVAPFSASIASGQLPPGLSLSASPPISITGIPTTRGTFMFTVRVNDSKGAQATKAGSITIS